MSQVTIRCPFGLRQWTKGREIGDIIGYSRQPKSMLRVIPARQGGSPKWVVEHDPQKPPNIFFDTNVWIGMNRQDVVHLKRLASKRGFCFSVFGDKLL
jgi:hypothetical protein